MDARKLVIVLLVWTATSSSWAQPPGTSGKGTAEVSEGQVAEYAAIKRTTEDILALRNGRILLLEQRMAEMDSLVMVGAMERKELEHEFMMVYRAYQKEKEGRDTLLAQGRKQKLGRWLERGAWAALLVFTIFAAR